MQNRLNSSILYTIVNPAINQAEGGIDFFLRGSDPDKFTGTLRTIIMGVAFEWRNKNGFYDQKEDKRWAFMALLAVGGASSVIPLTNR